MKLIVLSCDRNTELFEPFHHCLEKYYPSHPEVIYMTNTEINPYYRTICENYPLFAWTKGTSHFLKQIDDDQVLLMIDDCFIRREVDTDRIKYASEHLKGNIALMNFEKSWDSEDLDTDLIGFKKRKKGARYGVSIMCGLWDRAKLLDIIKPVTDPWCVEYNQNQCGYDYYINSGDYIIDWGYRTFTPCNIVKGKWTESCKQFLESEGLTVDYDKKGFYKI